MHGIGHAHLRFYCRRRRHVSLFYIQVQGKEIQFGGFYVKEILDKDKCNNKKNKNRLVFKICTWFLRVLKCFWVWVGALAHSCSLICSFLYAWCDIEVGMSEGFYLGVHVGGSGRFRWETINQT